MRIPGSTYRLQFNQQFDFARATAILDYLRDLGVTDLYCSPLFLAAPGSTHGYDACDPCQINPDLGTPADFQKLLREASARGLRLLLDIVPNHQGAHPANPRWWDVLKHGPNSEFARWFDIDWESPAPGLRGKVLLPILGDHYGAVLARGELQLAEENGEALLTYFGLKLPLAEAPAESLEAINRDPSLLHRVLAQQHYRLAYWRVGLQEINYRRFFDVAELVCVRVEDRQVFEGTHRLVFELIANGSIAGLRVDHPDGLRDPEQYFRRLRERTGAYILAEKILSGSEELPRAWPVNGTTGYDFLVAVNGLFVDPAGEEPLTRAYREFGGSERTCGEVALECKRLVLENLFVRELDALASALKEIAAESVEGADFTWRELRAALAELIAAFPVYRTYLGADRPALEPADRAAISSAEAQASRTPGSAFLARVLRLESVAPIDKMREFVMRFQQLTGPATAKGLEDTAFYRYFRLVSLNEVGGDPGKFGTSLDEFHAANLRRVQAWPHSMLATATHDTKRGEDLRARLNVLSELPREWREHVARWREITQRLEPRPSPNDEYLLYQTLLGAWERNPEPGFVERIQQCMLKSIREAKSATSWTEPNEGYENAVRTFVARLLQCAPFLESFLPFQKRVAFFGRLNSLSQILLKLFSPGVPDTYQGAELWDFSLVDPDNRRPVDFESRRRMLERIRSTPAPELLARAETGEIKLWLLHRCLNLRKERQAFFEAANYRPIPVTGARAAHLCAFARSHENRSLAVLAPRLLATLANASESIPLGEDAWKNTQLEIEGRWSNLLTGEAVESRSVARLLGKLPFAVLEKTASKNQERLSFESRS